jgi:hypothetical protein
MDFKTRISTFDSKATCEKTTYQSNPSYKSFKQVVFTCGDKSDLKKYLIKPRKANNLEKSQTASLIVRSDLSDNLVQIFSNPPYQITDAEQAFRNSLKYLFFKIKFGIYVQIKSNKLTMFVPFNNQNFKNNWSHLIHLPPGVNWSKYNQTKSKDTGSKYINWEPDASKWEIDNCVLDTRSSRNYKLINASYYIDMLEQTLGSRKVSDVEFFISHRDFPVLKSNYTQPYDQLYSDPNIPLEPKYLNQQFLPLCSMSSADGFQDLMLPTIDDWEIASQKIFYGMCRDQYKGFENAIETTWENKIDKVVFRGATTDCGYDEKTSARYLAHKLSQLGEIEELDAGITKLWFNDIKLPGKPIQYPKRIKPIDPIPFVDMSRYKYILNIDGSVTAFRLSAELAFGSVILKVDSKYKIWYMGLLVPWVHYIPIKSDLSDLKEKIEWCKANQTVCKTIGDNARKFYTQYINKSTMMDWIAHTLNFISVKINKKNI